MGGAVARGMSSSPVWACWTSSTCQPGVPPRPLLACPHGKSRHGTYAWERGRLTTNGPTLVEEGITSSVFLTETGFTGRRPTDLLLLSSFAPGRHGSERLRSHPSLGHQHRPQAARHGQARLVRTVESEEGVVGRGPIDGAGKGSTADGQPPSSSGRRITTRTSRLNFGSLSMKRTPW
jgi:hypothetical protein